MPGDKFAHGIEVVRHQCAGHEEFLVRQEIAAPGEMVAEGPAGIGQRWNPRRVVQDEAEGQGERHEPKEQVRKPASC